MVSLLRHANGIFTGFTRFSRYGSRRALLLGRGAAGAMSANA
jgi:hypothetical protein